MPSETSVSIEEDRCRACRSAAAWNGHAAQVATGTASATSSHCQPGNRVHGKTDSISEASVSGTKNTSASDQPPAQPPHRGLVGRGGVCLAVWPGRGRHLGGVAGRLDHADQVARGDGPAGRIPRPVRYSG